jgi:hypothetical protein
MKQTPRHRRGRSGFALIYLTIMMTALLAFASLAVDYARGQVAKTELLRAADAAARYAATGLGDGTAVLKAQAAAAENSADGRPVVLGAADVRTGNYDGSTRVFTAGATPINAVEVTAARRGDDGVPTVFAQVIGRSHVDVAATVIAMATPTSPGFTGLDGVTLKNSAFFGSYSSGTTLSPTEGSASGSVSVGTNGTFDSGKNTKLQGNLILGPSGSGSTSTGSTVTRPTNLVAPSDPLWTPGINPGGVPQNYTASDVVFAGGTYWFTSLTVNGSLSFSGPATVYVNGDVTLGGSLTAYGSVPSNLKIYQLNAHTFGDTGSNNITICAAITAPTCDFVVKNKLTFIGSALFRTITAKNTADFYYDQALGGGSGGVKVSSVK